MKIVIMGAGQIGMAAATLSDTYFHFDIELWDKVYAWAPGNVEFETYDATAESAEELAKRFKEKNVYGVINALPFFLVEKVALAARLAGCHYIDFTEDDKVADEVEWTYKGTGLSCATKCGVAPGFINYVGHDLCNNVIDEPHTLTIGVGALPRNVNFSDPRMSYNLTWSVDGLVNEYIKPCRVKLLGQETEVEPLTGLETVIADGVTYEAAFTSGGVGSLIKELPALSNVVYKTLRYPGHYEYVIDCVKRNDKDFERIKDEFSKTFPTTRNDVVVVYAEVAGFHNGRKARETFSKRFHGVRNLTAIQTTTAGAGTAIMELIITNKLTGIITHANVPLSTFYNTGSAQACFRNN